jgi:hypothetical protein
MGEEAVDAGDSYVIDMLNVVAHHFRGDYSLFGYRDVAGASGDDDDDSLAVLFAIALEHDGASEGTKLRSGHSGGDGCVLFLSGTGREHIAAMCGQAAEDFGNLARRFALGKNHFGHTLAQGAMVVDLDKAEVFKGQMAEALDGVVGGEALLSDLLEQLAKGLGIHRRRRHCRLLVHQFSALSSQ